jgi:hypothetical protein
MPCHWWNRWLHKKKREADKEFLLYPMLEKIPKEDTKKRLEAFRGFIWQKGQFHWFCDCGYVERLKMYDEL